MPGNRAVCRGVETGMKTSLHFVAAALCFGVAACGAAEVASDGTPDVSATTSTLAPTTTSADRGWIGGEPDFGSMGAEGAPGGADAMYEMAASDAAGPTQAAVGTGPAEQPIEGSLRAGSVDDNLPFDEYLAYRARIADLAIPLRGGDATGRIVVTVTGADGHPMRGAVLTVSDGNQNVVGTLTTTADGTARFL